MTLVPLPYIQDYISDGKRHTYYRRAGRRVKILDAACLPVFPGHPGFPEAYRAAAAQWATTVPATPATPSRAIPGTIAALIHEYRASGDYRQLALKTRTDYARVLDMLETRFAPCTVEAANRAWVMRLRDEAQATPRTANLRVAIIRKLMGFAVDREQRASNPAARIKPLRTGDSHRLWTFQEVLAMTGPAAGDIALPVLIGLCTAQREEDVLRLIWSAYDGRTIRLRQGKARHLHGEAVTLAIPVLPLLKAALDNLTRNHVVICLTAKGAPWKGDWFRHRFAATRDQLGLPSDLHFHGLRHTHLTILAEDGATNKMLQAIGGHRTTSQLDRYTKRASQKHMAEAALDQLGKRGAQQ